ncbi:MAG: group II intron reverse transcriptase/maturase [Gammaproteobacteria bacterium]|nr:group II intron reverse transcriptase/maturase [Gammaproteobacteria bacterium]
MTGQPKGNPGAPPAFAQEWKAINWSSLRKNVHHLQVRIAKAIGEKRWGKVRALQHILVTSRSAKFLAVHTVTTNKGKNTPGIDGVIWKTARAKFQAVGSLGRRGYQALPLRRIYIPKSNGKKRPLGIPTMKDRALQALYAMALIPVAETLADPHSYGFRPRRAVADAIAQCHLVLAKADRAQWILEGDIRACFDQIDHQWMLDHIPMDKAILRQWLEAGFIEKNVLRRTREGTPQGGIASPILANLVLDGLQALIAKVAPKGAKVNFVRYADDFICTANDPLVLKDIIMPVIQGFMGRRGLQLSEQKTHITHIDQGFDFLGFNIRKFNGKLLIRPAKKKVSSFLRRLKGCVRTLRYQKAHQVISVLNRKLKGWANFYRACVAKKVFSTIDHTIFYSIWRELRRRHPNKSATWVNKTYFKSKGPKNWLFFGVECKHDWRRAHHLFPMFSCKIRRHTKVISKATPFDPSWQAYFKKRAAIQLADRLRDRRSGFVTRTKWQWYPKGQLELFPAGLREQP